VFYCKVIIHYSLFFHSSKINSLELQISHELDPTGKVNFPVHVFDDEGVGCELDAGHALLGVDVQTLVDEVTQLWALDFGV